jgi:hypothetical protein
VAKKQRERRRPHGIDISWMPGWMRREQNKGRGPASRKSAGDHNRRVITEWSDGDLEVSYHATKGYRIRNLGRGAA